MSKSHPSRPDDPNRPTNSGKTVYQIEPTALALFPARLAQIDVEPVFLEDTVRSAPDGTEDVLVGGR